MATEQAEESDQATFTANGGSADAAKGGTIFIYATTGSGTFIANGTEFAGAEGGTITFLGSTSLEDALVIANAGTAGGAGGHIMFGARTSGEEARVQVFGNGSFDITSHARSGAVIGSLEGDGLVHIDSHNLALGSNNLDVTFSGVIDDVNFGPGSITKTGTGALILSNASTYRGGTNIEGGAVFVSNAEGSAVGTGPVQVDLGTFGGNGRISASVIVGSGSGVGAFLAAGIGGPGVLAMTDVAFSLDGAYNCELNTNTARSDKIVANGVTINSDAIFSFIALGNQTLAPGTVFRVIDNKSRDPIAGTFANMADSSTFTVGSNTFQANYAGGNGNDLTLTVVP